MTAALSLAARRVPLVAAALAGNALAAPAAALAQERPATVPIETVVTRARPEYDAVGLKLGALTVFPEVAIGVTYDDNIYRTQAPKSDDVYASIRPRILIQSASPRYPASIEATATVRRYATIETENSEQYSLTGTIGAEVTTGMQLTGSAGYSRQLEPRGSAGDTFIGGRPIVYDLFEASASATRDIGLIAVQVGGDIARYNYPGARVAGGVAVDQSFRDYRTSGGYARIAYSVSPAIATFIRGGLTRNDYPQGGGIDRASTGYSVLAGVSLGVTNLVSGSFGIGYLRENFADPTFGDISGLDYDLALNWSPTPLLSASLRGARSLQRSPFIGSAGGIQTTLALRADYELLRQLILSADLTHSRVSYRGLARGDRYAEAGVGARYLVNRTLGVTAAVNYRRQSSAGFGARDYTGFGATIGVTLHR